MIPQAGDIVRVRSRQYLVQDVVPPPEPRDSTLVRLTCVEDDAHGEALEVLWEKEIDAQLRTTQWERIASRGFDQPRIFSAFLHTLRWNCVTATNANLFQAPYRAGIEVKAYQLEPLRLALAMPRVNLFIADDVGLGKTIEAALILRELLIRQKVRRCVVCAPPSVVRQWRDELEERFGLTFVIYDRDYVSRVRQERGWAVNPWQTHTRFIISHALIRDETYAAPLRDWLGDFASGAMLILDEAHNVAPASGARYAIDSKLTRALRDLSPRFEHRLFLSATPHNGHSNSFSALLEILDPQRFCRGVPVDASLRDAVMVRRLKSDLRALGERFPRRDVQALVIDQLPDSTPELKLSYLLQQYRALREQRLERAPHAQRSAALLVLTSLQKRLLSSIEAFARTLDVHRRTLEAHAAAAAAAGTAEAALSAARAGAAAGTAAALPAAPAAGAAVAATKSPIPANTSAASSSFGDGSSTDAEAVDSASAASTLPFDLLGQTPGADDERAELSEQELEREDDDQMAAATAFAALVAPSASEVSEHDAALAPAKKVLFSEELALVRQMADVAASARFVPDARVLQLIAWIKQHLCPDLGAAGAAWLPRRVLIFTEYTDTKRYLQQQLGAAIGNSDRAGARIATFHGGMGEEGREAVKAAFNADPQRHPLRILIATDAAREGVNLQNACADLFHFDVPWNPGRIEQRNGRIDRKLQQADVVRCMYFVLPQRAEDRVLDVLVRKTTRIHEELGSISAIVEQRVDAALRHGIGPAHLQALTDAFDAPEPAASSSRSAALAAEFSTPEATARRATLDARLVELRRLLELSRQWIGLDDRHFRDALSASLATLGAPELAPLDASELVDHAETARWVLPLLHERKGADPTWASTLDSLRAPRKREQSLAEWRRDAPIRPVVFSDPGNLDGEVVHLHLEHRVVQRLLGRFLAMGFRDDDLCRACLLRTDHAEPRVVLLGRLSLFGEGGARLHDEILAAAADWVEPSRRTAAGLRPVGEAQRDSMLQTLEDALARPRLHASDAGLLDLLKQHAARDVAQLTASLTQRAAALRKRAERELEKRADAESVAMADILVAQQRRIERRQAEIEQNRQLSLNFNPDEQRQLAADRRHWAARLQSLAVELESEPARVRRSYAVSAARLEPVGLVYLWPLSN